MSTTRRFTLSLLKTEALVVVVVLALGALLWGAVSEVTELRYEPPGWVGLLGGFVLMVLLMTGGRLVAKRRCCDSWRDAGRSVAR